VVTIDKQTKRDIIQLAVIWGVTIVVAYLVSTYIMDAIASASMR
jgi:uncharacterized membrane protein YwzB